MKKYDIVKITKLTDELQKLNLQLDFHGVILSSNFDYSEVMFFNDNNIGESTICKVDNITIKKEDIELPKNIIKEIDKYIKENSNLEKEIILTKPKFKECDFVEVIVEKDKYIKYGVHCGDRGFIVLNEIIKNEMLVDFTGVDENGDIYGEEVSININDLKLVEKTKNESGE